MDKCCADVVALMKRKVTIQTESKVSDGQGGYTISWVDGDTVWASIEPLKGWERMQSMQMQTPVTEKIIMRYRSGLTTKNRLKFGTRIFLIKELLNLNEDSRFLQIKAMEQQ